MYKTFFSIKPARKNEHEDYTFSVCNINAALTPPHTFQKTTVKRLGDTRCDSNPLKVNPLFAESLPQRTMN